MCERDNVVHMWIITEHLLPHAIDNGFGNSCGTIDSGHYTDHVACCDAAIGSYDTLKRSLIFFWQHIGCHVVAAHSCITFEIGKCTVMLMNMLARLDVL